MTEHDSKTDKAGKTKNQLVEGMRKSKDIGVHPGQQVAQRTRREDRAPSRPGSSNEGGRDTYALGGLRWPD